MLWLYFWLNASLGTPPKSLVEFINCEPATPALADPRSATTASSSMPAVRLSIAEVERLLAQDVPLQAHALKHGLSAIVVCAEASATLSVENVVYVLAERVVKLNDPSPFGNERYVALALSELVQKQPPEQPFAASLQTSAAPNQGPASRKVELSDDALPPPLSHQKDGVWSTHGATPFGPGHGMRMRLSGGLDDDNLSLAWSYYRGFEDDFDLNIGVNLSLWPLGGSPIWLGARYRIFQLRAVDVGIEFQTGPKLLIDGSGTPSGYEITPAFTSSVLLSKSTALSASIIFPTLLFFERPAAAPAQIGTLGIGGRLAFTYNTRSWVGFFVSVEAAAGIPLWRQREARAGVPVRAPLFGASFGMGPQIRF